MRGYGGEDESEWRRQSIELLGRVASGDGDVRGVMRESRRLTRERIRAARSRASSSSSSSLPHRRHVEEIGGLEVSAEACLSKFRRLKYADLNLNHMDIGEWDFLDRQIEVVRVRLASRSHGLFHDLWSVSSPGVRALLDPVMRPIVEDFLGGMVEVERKERDVGMAEEGE